MTSGSLFASDPGHWLLAFAGALLIAGVAHRVRALSASGTIAAIALGTVLVGAAGWWAGLLLIAFFVTASMLSRVGQDRTTVRAARGSRRDAVQVLANGGIAMLCAVGYLADDHPTWLLALAGALAAANADTWSTEIGRTSRSLPRLVTSGRPVPAGTSGAVSGRGLVGAAAGAALIALLAGLGAGSGWFAVATPGITAVIAVGIAGFGGSVLDSLLGATVQEQRWCETCAAQTEHRIHHCGTPTRPASGLSWVSNDVVNLLCVTTGAVLAVAITALIG